MDGEELRLREATAARDALVIDLEQEREALRQQLGEVEQALAASAEETQNLREGQDSRTHELQARLSAKNAVVVELKEEIQALRQTAEEARACHRRTGRPARGIAGRARQQRATCYRTPGRPDNGCWTSRISRAKKTPPSAKLDSKLQRALQKSETLEADIERLRDFESIASARDEKISDLEQRLEERENEIDMLDLEVQRLRQVEERQQDTDGQERPVPDRTDPKIRGDGAPPG